MKNLIAFILLSFCFSTAKAQYTSDNLLRIRLSDNTPLRIAIDGRDFRQHGRSLSIGNLPEGKHRIKVYAFQNQGPYENRYFRHADLLYKGSVYIEPKSVTNCLVDVYKYTMAVNVKPIAGHHTSEDVPYNGDDIYAAKPDNSSSYHTPSQAPSYKQKQPTTANLEVGNATALTSIEVDNIKTRADKLSTDTEKEKALKNALTGHSFYIAQLRTLSNCLSFESSKLEFIEYEYYAKIIDKSNFPSLADCFKMDSNIHDFNTFVQNKNR